MKTTKSTIRLSQPTYVSSGYLGRGTPSVGKLLPAGTQVQYIKRDYVEDYLMFIETRHTVSIKDGQHDLFATRTTYRLREPFNPVTYFKDGIQQLPDGLWVSGTAGATYMADDGFGNLVKVPNQETRPNHYATCKSLPDCVQGLVYVIGNKVADTTPV